MSDEQHMLDRLPTLFLRLQKAGLPLGVDEYLLALHAIDSGFGVADEEALKRLCRILWVKTREDRRIFDLHCSLLDLPPPLTTPMLSPSSSTASSAPSNQPTRERSSALLRVEEQVAAVTTQMDEVQVAQALQARDVLAEPLPAYDLMSETYQPVSRRQMNQSWRYLRRPQRLGPPSELDIDATVDEAGRTGLFLEPVQVPARVNRTELLLCIDHDGSMVPFHMHAQRLIDTAQRSGRLGKVHIYYFHDCPAKYLYHDTAHLNYERIEDVLDQPRSPYTGVLIFSDAGAARGTFDPYRIEQTKHFLTQLQRHFRYIAWINPVPVERWSEASADEIMDFVPMFDLSRQGLDMAIRVLRGRFSPGMYSKRLDDDE